MSDFSKLQGADWREVAHNQGQEDAANGRPREAPFMIPVTKGAQEANKLYDEGYSHTESQKSSGCFLTTACVTHAGLTDNCHELTTLRSFRDSYVTGMPHGPAILAEYEQVAPILVQKIEQSVDRDVVLSGILATVTKAVGLIEHGACAEAFALYEAMLVDLKARYSKD